MERPTCKTCPYFDVPQRTDDDSHCIRHAPKPWLNPEDEGHIERQAAWPIVQDFDSCGEHPDFPTYVASLKGPVEPRKSTVPTLGEVLDDESNWPADAGLPTRVINALNGGWGGRENDLSRQVREMPLDRIEKKDLMCLSNFGETSWLEFAEWRRQIITPPDTPA